jgi:RNA polymerase sigma factor (sigma-70 family)
MTTNELLRSYIADRSEAAFAELVRQHIDLVYSAALRQVGGDAATAQDVTQAVFTELARNAPRLVRHTALSGWLYTSTRFLAAKARRAEQRRHAREQEAHVMNQLLQSAEPDLAWQELRPLLDDVMHELNDGDREAVLLRYFERQPLAEVGARLGLSENTARMRVERALDKLRAALAKRGVTSTVAALAGILAQRAVAAAPAGLSSLVSHAAYGAGAAGGIGLLKLLASTKAKLIAAAGLTALVAGLLVLPRLNLGGPAAAANARPATAPVAASAVAPSNASATTPIFAMTSPATSNQLVLHIVTADTGKPLPSVAIDYVLLEGTDESRQEFQSTRLGVCEIPVPRATVTRLVLWSRTDGFADTWLHWRLDRGDRIPEQYTLRLARAVEIGGQVVDSAGQPVADAGVTFGSGSIEPALESARPEAHVVAGIAAAPTDSAGRWSLRRIAPEVFHRMQCAAIHPEHVRASVSIADNPDAEKQMLAGTYVFRLGNAMTLSGVVLDPDGQPVAGAKLAVHGRLQRDLTRLRGGPLVMEVRSATSQTDGTFTLTGCAPGQKDLTVEAAGFVSTKVEVSGETNSPPLRIVLQRGKLLRLRVVDQRGAPIPDAEGQTAGDRGFLQTDAEGRLQWAGAAAEDVVLQVHARGYIWADQVIAKADGEEHTVTLSPALTLFGTVRDAASGEPVPHFRIVTGWPRLALPAHTTNLQWQSADRAPWISSGDGKYRQTVAEAGSREARLVFKFEADGYAPFVTRAVRADEGAVQIDVLLRPAVSTTVTVLLPDGNPAANADVGLVSPGGLLRVRPGGLARGNTYPSREKLPTTDGQGRFDLPPDDEVTGVIVANQAGYAEATRDALAGEPTIHLQLWGRIEGTLVSRGRGAAGRVVQFEYGLDPGMRNTVSADFFAYQANTDSDGRFVFAQVPPGKHRVVQRGTQKSLAGRGFSLLGGQPSVDVEVSSGQTTTVTLGNSNYTVTARLKWPAGLAHEPVQSVMVSLQRRLATPPPELLQNPEALANWRAQPDSSAAATGRRGPLQFSEDADGTFVADSVPPGNYTLTATVSEMPTTPGRLTPRANARVPVTVPADPPTGTLDLGEIELQPAN